MSRLPPHLQDNLRDIDEPCVITDCEGRIITWFLPGVLDKCLLVGSCPSSCTSWSLIDGQAKLNEGAKQLSSMLEKSIPKKAASKCPWRLQPKSFVVSANGDFVPGCKDFSGSWFAQAHNSEVWILWYNYFSLQYWLKRLQNTRKWYYYKPSVSYRDCKCDEWSKTMEEVQPIANALTLFTAPKLFHAGSQSIKKVKQFHSGNNPPFLKKVLDWPSVYSGITVISNRKTEYHNDKGGYASAFDLLFSCGTHMKCQLKPEILELGASLRYEPGSGVLSTGWFVQHGRGSGRRWPIMLCSLYEANGSSKRQGGGSWMGECFNVYVRSRVCELVFSIQVCQCQESILLCIYKASQL